MEGPTHYEKVIHGSALSKAEALKKLQEMFEKPNEELSKYELEKTPEDLKLIKETIAIVDRMVAQFGGEIKEYPLQNIYLLKPGSVKKMTEGKLSGGIHKQLGLKIGVEKKESTVQTAATLAHEFFHLKSPKVARVVMGEEVRLYRSGLQMIDIKDRQAVKGEEKKYFSMLEEAIVAECTDRFLDELMKEGEFKEELEAVKKIIDWSASFFLANQMITESQVAEYRKECKYISNPVEAVKKILAFSDNEENRRAYAAGMLQAMWQSGKVEALERYRERTMLYELLDKIMANSDGRYASREQVFDEFARANFTGHYLSLAKLVEGTLGEGSFRKIAEDFSVDPKVKEEDEKNN